jgi:hypothetical protein
MTDVPYNPLDKLNLGKSVAEALLDRPDHPLGAIPQFAGAGIYVIYYRGDHPLYAPVTEANDDDLRWPIYIGKAVPSGGRRGNSFLSTATGNHLFGRLAEHRESVVAADNLDVDDFVARYLIVDDIWIPLGESLLISTFKPVWNRVLDGFGNHDPGSGRYNGMRPMWDMLHPGRSWAARMRDHQLSVADIEARVTTFLTDNAPPREGHMKFTP